MKMRSILYSLIVTLFAALLFAGCSGSGGDDNGGKAPSGSDTYGTVKDTAGNPIPGVMVSDGYTCVQTDAKGEYKFTRHNLAYHVYYSLPAGYQVVVGKQSGIPEFYTRLQPSTKRYDFTLTPLAAPEKNFRLYCIGDPQVTDMGNVARFNNETVPDLKATVGAAQVPCYAIVLGDLVNNKWNLFPNMLSAMQSSKTGVPLFQTVGNHDHDFGEPNDLLSLRKYQSYFGPADYSFDRGDVHIVSMDNVLHKCGASDNYDAGFLESQYEWLKADLGFVSKDKHVILCVHIPFRGGASSGGSSVNKDKYYNEVLALLAQFREATIMSAHTHSNLKYIHTVSGKQIVEHITGTSCGAWWRSTVCTEGTPNGYAWFEIDGAQITDWTYKGVKFDRDFQIRLYRASDKFMGGGKAYTFSKKGASQIVANIWNADPTWVISVYEDGIKTGTMSRYTDSDAWTAAYHMGSLGLGDSYGKSSDHMFYYELKNASAAVRVEAVDRFGKTYSQSEFTDPNSSPATY